MFPQIRTVLNRFRQGLLSCQVLISLSANLLESEESVWLPSWKDSYALDIVCVNCQVVTFSENLNNVTYVFPLLDGGLPSLFIKMGL